LIGEIDFGDLYIFFSNFLSINIEYKLEVSEGQELAVTDLPISDLYFSFFNLDDPSEREPFDENFCDLARFFFCFFQ